MYKYKETQECTVTLTVEVETGGRVEREQSMPLLASDTLKFDYQSRFRINSADFKSKYRHHPLKLYLHQKSLTPKPHKAQDAVLGVCKVYVGLLFVATKTASDAAVSGWFHVLAETSGAILGQMLVEVSTERPLAAVRVEPRRSEPERFPESVSDSLGMAAVSTICKGTHYPDLDSLTLQLREKEKRVTRAEEDWAGETESFLATLKSKLFPRQ